MVYTCFACKWRSDNFPRRSYHQFPSTEELKKKWLFILGKSNISIGKRTSLCSIHFERDCFRYGLVYGKKILKHGSLPTLFLKNTENQAIDPSLEIETPQSMMESTFDMQHPIADGVQIEDLTSELDVANNQMIPSTSVIDDSTSHIEVPMQICSSNESCRKSSIEGQLGKSEILLMKKKISTLQRSVKRLRNSKTQMKSQITELKKDVHKYKAENKLMHAYRYIIAKAPKDVVDFINAMVLGFERMSRVKNKRSML